MLIEQDFVPWIGVRKNWKETPDAPWDQLVSLTPQELSVHALCIGASGCGKTTLIHNLIGQTVSEGRSLVVLDMRGDLVNACLALCEGRVRPEKIKLIDLRHGNRSHGFNPLNGEGPSYFRGLSLVDAIESATTEFGVQIAEYMRNASILLAETSRSIPDLESLFYDRAFRLECLSRSKSLRLIEFWQRFEELTPERQVTVAGSIANKVSCLTATPKLTHILSHPNPIDFGAHINQPGTVTLVALAVDEMHKAARIMAQLFVSSLCREIFARAAVPESKRVPVQFIVDEFSNFQGSDFESILAEGRRFKFSLLLALQTIAQFTPRMRQMVLANVGCKVVFRTGRDDAAIMSRDLTGDPSAYDFVSFKTGECILWRRGQGVVEVETNEPLLPDLERHEESIRRLVAAMIPEESTEDEGIAELGRPALNPPARPVAGDDLEDWLCA